MKGIVTEHSEICFICGRQTEAEHHLIFGTAGRELSEKDGDEEETQALESRIARKEFRSRYGISYL